MPFKLSMMALSAASSIIGAASMDYFAPQQGVPAAGGKPSAAPSQTNPTPRPINPGANAPVQPVATPGQTVNPATQPGAANPGSVSSGVNPGVYARPFAFTNPTVEARYTDNARRLVALEQRLNKSNLDLTKRLGEARALTGERQTAATFDVLQQILKEQAAMNQYLVRARTTWSGELDGSVPITEDEYTATNDGSTQPVTQPGNQPVTQPVVNPSAGGNQTPTTQPPR